MEAIAVARDILRRAREDVAGVVIGYGPSSSNDQLRRVLGLTHAGSVRLVDRLVADGLVERRAGRDRRTVALFLTGRGRALREELLTGRLAAIRPLLEPLTEAEQGALTALLHKIFSGMDTTDLARCTLCRLCDDRVCVDCPIPADSRRQNGAA